MPRSAPTLPVNAKMYRHFAIISLTLTAGLAMFANSGNRDAIEDHIAENSQAQKAQPKKVASNFKDNRKGGGSFGDEAGSATAGGASSYIGEDDTIAGPELVAAGSVTMPRRAAASSNAAINDIPPGMTLEEFRALQARQKRLDAAPPASSDASASEIAAMMAASKARSQMGPGG